MQLNGSVRDLVYNADGTLDQSYSTEFQLNLFPGEWVCKTAFDDYSELLAFDGTNTYTQHYFPPPTRSDTSGIDTAKITTAEIRRGSSCIDGIPPTRILWIAYCGKPLFQLRDGQPIVSPWGSTSLLGSDSMAYSVEWLDDRYMIPRELKIFMSYNFWRTELRTKRRDPNEPNPFEDGELMGEYNVLASTNTGNIILPTEFELVRYAINSDRKAVIREKFHGSVTQVRNVDEAFQLPLLHMKAQVQDFRFSSETQKWLHVSYKAPAGPWPTTNDPLVTANLEAAVTNYSAYEKLLYLSQIPITDPRKRGTASLILFIVLFLPPLIYLLVQATKGWGHITRKRRLTNK